jgi:hypothetical protein
MRLAEQLYAEGASTCKITYKNTSDGVLECKGVHRDDMRTMLTGAQMFSADNVAEYFYAVNSKEFWDSRYDFPCLAPPFLRMFIEWNRPSCIYSNEKGRSSSAHLASKTGVLLSYVPTAFGWHLDGSLFVRNADKGLAVGVFLTYSMDIDRNGHAINDLKHNGSPGAWVSSKEVIDAQSANWFPALLAVTFCNCKNVAKVQNVPSKELVNARDKKDRPAFTYTTLRIDPMKEVLRKEGESEVTGLKKALHICRGHFAQYEAKGLFGKHKGTFWVPQHVKGHQKHGVAIKTYDVQPKENV